MRAFGPASADRRRRLFVVPQVAVGVVLDDRHAGRLRRGDQRVAPRRRDLPAGRILEVRQQVGEPGARRPLRQTGHRFGPGPFRVAVETGEGRLVGHEGLQRAQVGGRLDRHRRAGVDQHLADQVEPLLRAGGDQDLIGRDGQAGLAEPGGDPFAQRQEALAGGVLQRLAAADAQYRVAGGLERLHREGVRRRQAAGHRAHPWPLGHLQNLPDDRRAHPCRPLRCRPRAHAYRAP